MPRRPRRSAATQRSAALAASVLEVVVADRSDDQDAFAASFAGRYEHEVVGRAGGGPRGRVLRTVASLGGGDTTCAIAGSVVASCVGASGIQPVWLEAREALPR